MAEQELSNRANAIAFHPNKPLALIGTDVHRGTEGLVRRYNIGSKRWEEVLDTKNVAGVKIEEPGVYGLEFNPDGIRLAVLTRSTVLLIDWESQQVIHSIAQRGQLLYQSMHFSHDGKSLVLSDNNRTFWVYDTTTWACRETVIPDDKQMKQFCITRDDKYLCAAISTPYHSDYQGLWALYSFPEIKLLAYVPANMRGVGQIVADPKEDRVVTGGGDGTIMTWSIENVLKSNQ